MFSRRSDFKEFVVHWRLDSLLGFSCVLSTFTWQMNSPFHLRASTHWRLEPSPFCWSGKKFVEKRSCSSDQEAETRSLKPQIEAHKKANAKRVRGEVAERVRCLPKRSGEQGIMTLALTDHLKHTLVAERFYSIPAAAHATMTRIRSNLCCGSLNWDFHFFPNRKDHGPCAWSHCT